MVDCEKRQALVFDNGTGAIKVGFAGDDDPSAVFPSIVGRGENDIYVGQEAKSRLGKLTMNYPIKRGIITNWDDMIEIWQHAFYNELRVNPEEQAILLTETSFNPKANKEKMAQIMFETFNVPAMSVQIQARLSFYASGVTTGIVMDIGDGLTKVVPIFEGRIIEDALICLDLGGQDLTALMEKLLRREQHYVGHVRADFKEIVRDIKEKVTYVAGDYEQYLDGVNGGYRHMDSIGAAKMRKQYKLPDGKLISLGFERFHCPEALFRPSLIGLENVGIHRAIFNSIMKCDPGIRRHLYESAILSGGSTMFDQIAYRLTEELKNITYPKNHSYKVVHAEPRTMYGVWKGGSVLASLSDFNDSLISKQEYDESGPSVIHSK